MTINQQNKNPSVTKDQPATENLGIPHPDYVEAEHTTYEEVDGIVSNADDQEMRCSTFRSWFIGILLVILLSGANTYFYYHKMPIKFYEIYIFLLSFALGNLFARILPSRSFQLPFNNNYKFSFNPGPFTIKEHALIFLIVAFSSNNYHLEPLDATKQLYKNSTHPIWIFLHLLSIRLAGCGFAGIMRRFLVWPSSMVWPHIMPYIVLFRTLHNENTVDSHTNGTSTWKLRRLQFFYLAFICQFVYSWFPSYFVPILTTFAWVCFFKPHNSLVVELTGEHKFGFGALNLNLGAVNINRWLNSPLVVPGWAQLNVAVGFVLTTWIVSSILYFSNLWNMRNMSSMKTEYPYHEDGLWYDWYKVINYSDVMDNVRLNVTTYEQYGSPYFSLSAIITYACQLAIFPALLIHTILYHGKDLLKQFHTSLRNRDNDIHCHLMAQYKETPEWWFTILFILPITLAILVCDYSKVIPWYFLLIALLLPLTLVIPIGILTAHTGLAGLTDLFGFPVSYLLCSLALSHNQLASTTFQFYMSSPLTSVITFIGVLKISHYMKIPPRCLFVAIIISSTISCSINFIASYYIRTELINDVCEGFDAPSICTESITKQYNTLIFSIMGPSKMLGHLSHYSSLLWMILVGALLPVLFWYFDKKCSQKYPWAKHIHVPILLIPGMMMMQISSGSVVTWLIIGFVCNVFIRRWTYGRYLRILSIASDHGYLLCLFFKYFVVRNEVSQFEGFWNSDRLNISKCLSTNSYVELAKTDFDLTTDTIS